jgi:hypothetical protein
MKRFLWAAITYFSVAVAVVMLTRENGLTALMAAWQGTLELAPTFGRIALILLGTGALIAWKTKVTTIKALAAGGLMAFVATLLFQSGFTLIKTSLPNLVPFYADATFARWDALLHGGQDPWEFTHWIAGFLPMEWVIPVYLHVWVWPAICLPVVVAVLDADQARAGRTLLLYLLSWVLIGNILALFGMSAGPVFYDRIYGGDRFTELTAALEASPILQQYFGPAQDYLWTSYSTNSQSIGAGISAFPSVHVSVSMVGALYLWERSRLLGVIGAVFVAVILFLSVYSGYHYALDGYFSIAVMWGVWAFMRRRAATAHVVSMPNGKFA